jgi:hypothetical protein
MLELCLTVREVIEVIAEPSTPNEGGFIPQASGHVAQALRYWEPKRLFYNGIMLVVVGVNVALKWPQVQTLLTFDLFLLLFLLAVLANVCYCAVYAVDLFVRFSGLDAAWEKGRIAVLLVGTAFAAVIAHFFSLGILS